MDNMNDYTYRLPGKNGGLSVMGHMTACKKCGRKVLVEMGLIGVPHHVGLVVTCGECVEPSEQIRKEHPEIVSKVENWLHGGTGQDEPEV
jgi:hypothetical protein